MSSKALIIGVVGPCAAGKSTLVTQLRELGYTVRHIAQEHSYVQDMWRQIANPDYLIYLDVTFEVSKRRSDTSWEQIIYQNQLERLTHARQHADLYIKTDHKSTGQVLDLVLENLETA